MRADEFLDGEELLTAWPTSRARTRNQHDLTAEVAA